MTGVACPFCDHAEPRLIESDRYWCPRCRREFVQLSAAEYAEAITASRPAVLIGDILKRL